jgi:hypothetical protein
VVFSVAMLVSNVQYRLLFLIYNVVKIFENNFKTGYIVHFVAKFKKKKSIQFF